MNGSISFEDTGVEGSGMAGYKVIRKIGQGGMGSVYLAERADGTCTKKVAIKIVSVERNSRDIVERFRREREILDYSESGPGRYAGAGKDQVWVKFQVSRMEKNRIDQAAHPLALSLWLRMTVLEETARLEARRAGYDLSTHVVLRLKAEES